MVVRWEWNGHTGTGCWKGKARYSQDMRKSVFEVLFPYTCVFVFSCYYVCVCALGYSGRDSDPVFQPMLSNSICLVHFPCPAAMIPSDHRASSNTRPINGLLLGFQVLHPPHKGPRYLHNHYRGPFALSQINLRQPI